MGQITHCSFHLNIDYWDYYILCHMDVNAARVLQRMEYWDKIKGNSLPYSDATNDHSDSIDESLAPEPSRFVFKTEEELYWELFGSCGEKNIPRILRYLEHDLHYLVSRRNPYKGFDRTKQYEFQGTLIQNHINKLSALVQVFLNHGRRLSPIQYAIELLTVRGMAIEDLEIDGIAACLARLHIQANRDEINAKYVKGRKPIKPVLSKFIRIALKKDEKYGFNERFPMGASGLSFPQIAEMESGSDEAKFRFHPWGLTQDAATDTFPQFAETCHTQGKYASARAKRRSLARPLAEVSEILFPRIAETHPRTANTKQHLEDTRAHITNETAWKDNSHQENEVSSFPQTAQSKPHKADSIPANCGNENGKLPPAVPVITISNNESIITNSERESDPATIQASTGQKPLASASDSLAFVSKPFSLNSEKTRQMLLAFQELQRPGSTTSNSNTPVATTRTGSAVENHKPAAQASSNIFSETPLTRENAPGSVSPQKAMPQHQERKYEFEPKKGREPGGQGEKPGANRSELSQAAQAILEAWDEINKRQVPRTKENREFAEILASTNTSVADLRAIRQALLQQKDGFWRERGVRLKDVANNFTLVASSNVQTKKVEKPATPLTTKAATFSNEDADGREHPQEQKRQEHFPAPPVFPEPMGVPSVVTPAMPGASSGSRELTSEQKPRERQPEFTEPAFTYSVASTSSKEPISEAEREHRAEQAAAAWPGAGADDWYESKEEQRMLEEMAMAMWKSYNCEVTFYSPETPIPGYATGVSSATSSAPARADEAPRGRFRSRRFPGSNWSAANRSETPEPSEASRAVDGRQGKLPAPSDDRTFRSGNSPDSTRTMLSSGSTGNTERQTQERELPEHRPLGETRIVKEQARKRLEQFTSTELLQGIRVRKSEMPPTTAPSSDERNPDVRQSQELQSLGYSVPTALPEHNEPEGE